MIDNLNRYFVKERLHNGLPWSRLKACTSLVWKLSVRSYNYVVHFGTNYRQCFITVTDTCSWYFPKFVKFHRSLHDLLVRSYVSNRFPFIIHKIYDCKEGSTPPYSSFKNQPQNPSGRTLFQSLVLCRLSARENDGKFQSDVPEDLICAANRGCHCVSQE